MNWRVIDDASVFTVILFAICLLLYSAISREINDLKCMHLHFYLILFNLTHSFLYSFPKLCSTIHRTTFYKKANNYILVFSNPPYRFDRRKCKKSREMKKCLRPLQQLSCSCCKSCVKRFVPTCAYITFYWILHQLYIVLGWMEF